MCGLTFTCEIAFTTLKVRLTFDILVHMTDLAKYILYCTVKPVVVIYSNSMVKFYTTDEELVCVGERMLGNCVWTHGVPKICV